MAILSRTAPNKVETSLGDARFDDEGRFLVAHFGRLSVASIYFPKGNGKERDNSRVGYKLDFYRAAFERLDQLRRRGRVYVLGDFNTAHHEIDLARPKGNRKASGFLPVERQMLTQLQNEGWVDTFRAAHPVSQIITHGGVSLVALGRTMSVGESMQCTPRPPLRTA